MSFSIKDLTIEFSLPRLPSALSAFELTPVSFEARSKSFDVLTRRFKLGELRPLETPFGRVLGGKRGELHYFAASGGLLARDATATAAFTDERRPWPKLEERKQDQDSVLSLSDDVAKKILAEGRALLAESGLALGRQSPAFATEPRLTLDQWTQLDEKGTVLARGGGAASVSIGYEVEGLPILGPGAKTALRFEPAGTVATGAVGGVVSSEVLHVLREFGAASKLELPSTEAALAAALADDRQFALFKKRGQRIRLTRCAVGYYAQPALAHQGLLLPVFEIEGAATLFGGKNDGKEIRFARYFPAVSSRALHSAGLASHQALGEAREPSVEVVK